MDAQRGATASSGSSAKSSDGTFSAANPFVLLHGRRYLRDHPYPLPCDLVELQRQNLHTQLATSVFGTPICCSAAIQRPPNKVLEIACGTGFWSSLCHDFFSSRGRPDVEFVGLDIVSVAPNMRQHGINWRFVQHDLRNMPLPFDDAEFDLVLMKDMSIVVPVGLPSERLLDEAMRVLRPGGALEWWECDYQIRSLLPHPRPSSSSAAAARSRRPQDLEQATATGTFVITPATPFAAQATNKFLCDYNAWIYATLDKRQLSTTPCSKMSPAFLQEPDSLFDCDCRRVAIPLGVNRPRQPHESATVPSSETWQARALDLEPLTGDQLAIRQTALQVIVQLIESMEPQMKEASDKSAEEWSRWWMWMMTDLVKDGGACNGECFEIGSWWAIKV